MIAVLVAFVPVFLLIALGHGIRRTGFVPDSFWAPADKLTFYVFFPALLFHNLATADLAGLPLAGAVGALVIAIAAVAGGILLLRPHLPLDGPAFTSVLQGSIRPNTYVGLGLAFTLLGPQGLGVAAIAVAAFVPLVNVISATVLARYAGEGPRSPLGTLALVARNPLVLACAGGLVVNASAFSLPGGLADLLDVLGRAAVPLGLISVGAGLAPAAVRRTGAPVLMASLCKLVILPGLAAGTLALFAVHGPTATIALLFAALPTSATSYVMARQMGGDHTLMAGIITVETLIAAVTLPAWLIVLG